MKNGIGISTYVMIATMVLLLSFAPPLLALLGMPGPSGNEVTVAPLDTVIVMILMHIIPFGVSLFIFTRLIRES